MRTLSVLIVCAGLMMLVEAIQPSRAQEASSVRLVGTVVKAYSDASNPIVVRFDHASQAQPLKCKAATCPGLLRDAQVGDVITVDVNPEGAPTSITKVERIARPVEAWIRCIAFGGSLVFLYLISEFR